MLKIPKKKGKRSKSLRLWNNFENDSLPDSKMAMRNLEEGGNKELKRQTDNISHLDAAAQIWKALQTYTSPDGEIHTGYG